jgi:hypothetical protein
MCWQSQKWQLTETLTLYEGVTKSFRTESITKYTLTTRNTRREATQSVMAIKLTRLTHKIALPLHLVAESCTICSSRSRRPVRKLLDTPSYVPNITQRESWICNCTITLLCLCTCCQSCCVIRKSEVVTSSNLYRTLGSTWGTQAFDDALTTA